MLSPTPHIQIPWRKDAHVMALVGLVHASSHFSHLLLPLMFPAFIQEFDLGYAQLGLVMTLFFLISGVGQALSGFLVDRLGARPVLWLSLVLLCAACLVASQANGYNSLLLSGVLFGLGNCSFHPVDFTILNQRISPSRLGYAFSTHGLTGNLGWAIAPTFMMGIAAVSDWRTAYLCAAGVFAFLLLLAMVQGEHLVTHAQQTVSLEEPVHVMAFMKLPVVWWCFGFFVFSTMTLAVIQSFSVSILQAMHPISFSAATNTLTGYLLCAALGIAVGGYLASKSVHQSEKVVAISMIAAAALLMLCASSWLGTLGSMLALAVSGMAAGIGGPSRDLMIKKATPQGATGRVYGLVYSGMDVGFSIAPAVFGLFMDRGWHAATLMGVALTLVISAALALVVAKQPTRFV